MAVEGEEGIAKSKKKTLFFFFSRRTHARTHTHKRPQQTISTAIFFMHKFYLNYSFSEHNRYVSLQERYFNFFRTDSKKKINKQTNKQFISSACLFLACKSDDNLRRLRDLVNVIHVILYPNDPQPIKIGSDVRIKAEQIIRKKNSKILIQPHPHQKKKKALF